MVSPGRSVAQALATTTALLLRRASMPGHDAGSPDSRRPDNNQLVGAGFGAPDFAVTAQELTHVRTGTRQREDLKGFLHWIEPHERVRAEVAEPHLVLIVYIDGISPRVLPRQLPFFPGVGGGVIPTNLPRIPFADPDIPFRVRPHSARALVRRRRLDHGRSTGDRVKTRDVASRKRRIVHDPIRRGGNSIGPRPFGSIEHLDFADLGVQSPVDAALA